MIRLIVLLATLWAGTGLAAEPARTFNGRPIGDVLDGLRAQGLTFIYNTQIVPSSLRVQNEPRSRAGIALAREILAAHGLKPSEAAPGVYAVVVDLESSAAADEDSTPALMSEPVVEEITVHASRYRLTSDVLGSDAVISQEDIQSMPRLGDETLRAVQRLPGVAGNGFSSLGAVRGGNPNETAVVLDGLRLYEPFHLKNFLSPVSLLDSRVIQSMDVYSGGFPVIHGDRMSGIIDARSIEPDQARYYEAGLSLFHLNLLAASQFSEGRGNALISARRSNVGDLAHYSEKEFGEPQYSDAFAKVGYRFSDSTRGSVHALASSDRISAIRNAGRERANTEYRNVYTWGTLAHDWSESSNSRLILSYTDVNNERHGTVNEPGQRLGEVSDERNFHVIGLRGDHQLEWMGTDQRFGFEVRRLWGHYDYESVLVTEAGFPFPSSQPTEVRRSATPKPDGFESAAWWDSRFRLGKRWTVLAGLRFDTQTYDGSGDAAQVAPRLNVLYDVSEATRLRASWGRFFQSQGINELQVEDGVDRFYQAPHADHWIVSVEHEFAPGLDLRLELYRKDYRHLYPRFENLLSPLVLLPEMESDRVEIASKRAQAQGAELLFHWQLHDAWRGWFSYSWSEVHDRVDRRDVLRSWDQKHAVQLGLMWMSGPWSASLTNSYHTGWPITELSVVATPEGGSQVVAGPRNAERLGHYNSLDFRVTRTFILPRGVLDVFVEGTNALFRENPCCVDYSLISEADGSVTANRAVDTWLPFVPSIGVLWRY